MFNSKKVGMLAGLVISTTFASQAVFAGSITLDFDTDALGNAIQNAQVIDDEYAGFGVSISAINPNRDFDLAISFDSEGDLGVNDDPDLEASFSGGNNAGARTDNLLIISETSAGCASGVCNVADDEGRRLAGSLVFDFDREIDSVSFDLVDVEEFRRRGVVGTHGSLSLLDMVGSVINDISFDTFAADFGAIYGDNFFNSIGDIEFAGLGVYGLSFNFGGSAGLDNVTVAYSAVPELDGAGLPIALSLLGGLIALRAERRRKA